MITPQTSPSLGDDINFVRLAYADAIAGPWKIFEPGVYTHVASPEILVDDDGHRLVMGFHGMRTEGSQWPSGESAAREWVRQHGYGHFTQAAESTDGLHFHVLPSITKASYLLVFPFGGYLYGTARLGALLRTKDPMARFENGPNPFRGGPYANPVRDVAVMANRVSVPPNCLSNDEPLWRRRCCRRPLVAVKTRQL